ncbi:MULTISPECIES: hypothetical protein [Flavobacterium]|jgi:hypothetical protein|uniref:Bacteriocin n=1 Tax=Flavobacterium tructae TaxID=1114873 RepID=A0A1S1J9U0_9FLAO|nr:MULTISPECIES: hypothetical protein [Flavobacterium]MDL2141215.1 hypothetical protein [Flavobacterium tructae]OHT46279.1 hypothetical protein BHE19_01865 [Flavobacterium tructae]OXB22238.1 hypothetical protein B0A71_01895 [Flavobacterium tructae]
MLKIILNLEGAQELSAFEQKSMVGGQPINPPKRCCVCPGRGSSTLVTCDSICSNGTIPAVLEDCL